MIFSSSMGVLSISLFLIIISTKGAPILLKSICTPRPRTAEHSSAASKAPDDPQEENGHTPKIGKQSVVWYSFDSDGFGIIPDLELYTRNLKKIAETPTPPTTAEDSLAAPKTAAPTTAEDSPAAPTAEGSPAAPKTVSFSEEGTEHGTTDPRSTEPNDRREFELSYERTLSTRLHDNEPGWCYAYAAASALRQAGLLDNNPALYERHARALVLFNAINKVLLYDFSAHLSFNVVVLFNNKINNACKGDELFPRETFRRLASTDRETWAPVDIETYATWFVNNCGASGDLEWILGASLSSSGALYQLKLPLGGEKSIESRTQFERFMFEFQRVVFPVEFERLALSSTINFTKMTKEDPPGQWGVVPLLSSTSAGGATGAPYPYDVHAPELELQGSVSYGAFYLGVHMLFEVYEVMYGLRVLAQHSNIADTGTTALEEFAKKYRNRDPERDKIGHAMVVLGRIELKADNGGPNGAVRPAQTFLRVKNSWSGASMKYADQWDLKTAASMNDLEKQAWGSTRPDHIDYALDDPDFEPHLRYDERRMQEQGYPPREEGYLDVLVPQVMSSPEKVKERIAAMIVPTLKFVSPPRLKSDVALAIAATAPGTLDSYGIRYNITTLLRLRDKIHSVCIENLRQEPAGWRKYYIRRTDEERAKRDLGCGYAGAAVATLGRVVQTASSFRKVEIVARGSGARAKDQKIALQTVRNHEFAEWAKRELPDCPEDAPNGRTPAQEGESADHMLAGLFGFIFTSAVAGASRFFSSKPPPLSVLLLTPLLQPDESSEVLSKAVSSGTGDPVSNRTFVALRPVCRNLLTDTTMKLRAEHTDKLDFENRQNRYPDAVKLLQQPRLVQSGMEAGAFTTGVAGTGEGIDEGHPVPNQLRAVWCTDGAAVDNSGICGADVKLLVVDGDLGANTITGKHGEQQGNLAVWNIEDIRV